MTRQQSHSKQHQCETEKRLLKGFVASLAAAVERSDDWTLEIPSRGQEGRSEHVGAPTCSDIDGAWSDGSRAENIDKY
jgi:hypothetical protein